MNTIEVEFGYARLYVCVLQSLCNTKLGVRSQVRFSHRILCNQATSLLHGRAATIDALHHRMTTVSKSTFGFTLQVLHRSPIYGCIRRFHCDYILLFSLCGEGGREGGMGVVLVPF